MTQLLAIDWDQHEVRYVVGAAKGDHLVVTAAGAAPLAEAADQEAASPGEVLRRALAGERVGRCKVLVALGRNRCDLVSMTLPPARDNELPELVTNEALRQLPGLSEEAAIDFLTLNDNPAEPRDVVALVCPPKELAAVRQTCQQAELTADRLLLRPLALASLAAAVVEPAAGGQLLVGLVGDEIDLAVVSRQRVLVSRTVKLPGPADDSATSDRLLAEINRTLAVIPQVGGQSGSVERVVLLGTSDNTVALAERIVDELGLDALAVDPYTSVDFPEGAAVQPAERFAPLVGMLWGEVRHSHAIDFLNPRRPPSQPDRRRWIAMGSAGLLLVAAMLGWHMWSALADLDSRNERLAARLGEMNELAKRAARQRRLATSIQNWEAGSVNWLDELRDFCLRFPSSRDAVVLHMTLAPSTKGGGLINLDGLVRDPAIVLRMENRLRDDYHQVVSKGVQERDQDKSYTWHFETSITVIPRGKEEYRRQADAALVPADEQEVDRPTSAQPARGDKTNGSPADKSGPPAHENNGDRMTPAKPAATR